MTIPQVSVAGIVGLSASSILFLLVTVLLLTSWRGRLQGGLLVSASLGTLAWSLSSVSNLAWGIPGIPALLAVETLRNIIWFGFFASLLRFEKTDNSGQKTTGWAFKTFTIGSVGGGAVLSFGYLLISLFDWQVNIFQVYFSNLMLIQAALSIAVLAVIEQVIRLTSSDQRWAIRYLVLGVAGMLIFDFILYTDAVLFGVIRPGLWDSRGYIASLMAPLLALTATRNPQWSVRVFISRGVVFHSTILFAAGLYLLAMAGAGYYVRSFGGEWGDVLQTVLVFTGIVGLISLLLSKEFRTRIKLFLAKNFYQNKYEYGEEWLRFTERLASRQSENNIPETVLLAICDLLNVEGGALWLRDENQFVQTATSGNSPLFENRIELPTDLIDFFQNTGWILDLDDRRSVDELPLPLPEELSSHKNLWLILPLVHRDQLIALLSLSRSPISNSFNWEDRELLQVAGKQASGYLALLQLTEQLAQSKQFEAFNRLSAFLVHDLKNIVAQLDLVVTNSAKHGENPAFIKDTFSTVANATKKIHTVLNHLRRESPSRTPVLEETVIKQVIEKVLLAHSGNLPVPKTSIADDIPSIYLEQNRLEMILGHLLQNAQEATPDKGDILISATQEADRIIITVEDNGCGMSEEFIRNQLFKPFRTTKGNAGMGIGVYEARDFAVSLGGNLSVISQPSRGTTFTLSLPI